MTEVITTVINFFNMIVDVVSNFVAGVGALLSYIPGALSLVTSVINYMPTELTVFAVAFISVSIVYLIVGR